jgi:bla regulator protein BlaR1
MKIFSLLRWSGSSHFALILCTLVGIGMIAPAIQAQSASPAFDVVSVRENRTGGMSQFASTADGYRVTNEPLVLALLTAYVPQSGKSAFFTPNLPGMPDWAKQMRVDIDAKVSNADLADWQKPDLQAVMLRNMLQIMLKDRFKLEVHREMREMPMFFLEAGKNGPKLKESVPGEAHPGGKRLPGNEGVMRPDETNKSVHFYETSMAAMAAVLSDMFAGRPVEDRTGLKGRYDFEMVMPAREGGANPQAAGDNGPTVFSTLSDLGLKLEAGKSSVETLVVDHVERPSEN